jgi:hypothetical protein
VKWERIAAGETTESPAHDGENYDECQRRNARDHPEFRPDRKSISVFYV